MIFKVPAGELSASRNVTVEPLRRDQYRQVAEWQDGPQADDLDWEQHARDMETPNRLNFGVYVDGKFCAAICYEKVSPTVSNVHVSKQPHTIKPYELATLLIQIADFLYQNGIEELQAIVPFNYRPSRRLAIRTGMTYRGNIEQGERFAITKAEYYRLHYGK